ncbi:aspartyl aminopeptidase-like [Mya arenaria]|uniref:aspartyl aminopeptidase-like n=1 Tax=Mya arenaria TaxID=6604 RepID=UPI0022E66B20|nr:aspartyl aminopeptidase-like [Mya arenaria]
MTSKDLILSTARQFLAYVNKAPSPYHAVEEIKSKLVAAGFRELRDTDQWQVKPKDKCFVTKNQSTIIAFAVGGQFKPGNGFSIVGAHTDSPCLKVKPVSKVNKSGYNLVGVECYGGGIWHTWFDRDLTIAGRVLVKAGKSIEHRLVNISRPILRVPHVAIHLQRDHNEKFSPNKETNICPVLSTEVQSQLGKPVGETADTDKSTPTQADKHQPLLVKLLCDELKVEPEQLMDFDLHLADTQPAAIGGALEEFIFSPRLDNLLNAYTAAVGLVNSCSNTSLDSDPTIRMISLFDNEEVGSQSAQGAGSSFQEYVLRRLSSGGSQTAFEEAIPKSYMISADQAHALHPNYSEKHEGNHQPGLHKGIVVKINSNQRYASTAITNTILREIGRIADVPLQDFVVRNDVACGSTIGPIMSAKLGMATVDIGAPQLSMHSIREMCCTTSVLQSQTLYQAFFEHYPEVFSSLKF